MFESWFYGQLKLYFIPLVEVVATQDIPKVKQTLKKHHKQKSLKINSQD